MVGIGPLLSSGLKENPSHSSCQTSIAANSLIKVGIETDRMGRPITDIVVDSIGEITELLVIAGFKVSQEGASIIQGKEILQQILVNQIPIPFNRIRDTQILLFYRLQPHLLGNLIGELFQCRILLLVRVQRAITITGSPRDKNLG